MDDQVAFPVICILIVLTVSTFWLHFFLLQITVSYNSMMFLFSEYYWSYVSAPYKHTTTLIQVAIVNIFIIRMYEVTMWIKISRHPSNNCWDVLVSRFSIQHTAERIFISIIWSSIEMSCCPESDLNYHCFLALLEVLIAAFDYRTN